MEIRCEGRIHGRVVDGLFEVKCRSGRCGARSGIVVLHYYDLLNGEHVKTKKFQDPAFRETSVGQEPEKEPACR